jgi:mono/diheme cytochrome c family protein
MRLKSSAVPLSILATVSVSFVAVSAPPVKKVEASGSAATYKRVRSFVDKYCVGCHGADGAAAGINLTKHKSLDAMLNDRAIWDKVIGTIESQSMPPKGVPHPEIAARTAVVNALQSAFSQADCKINDPGRVTMRRLNKVEYNNTVRDLLRVTSSPADKFPSDDVGYGFDNIGDVLSISPLLMEKYVGAARQLSREAILALEDRVVPPKRILGKDLKPIAGGGMSPYVGDALMFGTVSDAGFTIDAPVAGSYTLKLEASGQQLGAEPCQMRILQNGKVVGQVDVANRPNRPKVYTQAIQIDAPGKVVLGVGFLNDGFEGPGKDRNLIVHSVELEYPESAGSAIPLPPSHRYLVRKQPDNASDAAWDAAMSYNVRLLMRRAYRRPVTAAEVARVVTLSKTVRARKLSFERGLQLALQAVLVSPNFLYKVEVDPDPNNPKATRTLNPYELATRLSYFIWSSMPDDTLLAAAESGKLATDVQIEAQVSRMVKDAKSLSLAQNFAGQWLNLRKAAVVQPDVARFPTFNEGLRRAMQQETELYFDRIVRDDRPVMELVKSDYTFLNEPLAKHYGIPDVTGDSMRLVKLSPGPRGGVLGHASVLMLTSNPGRTSPVKRGKWVLENILGTPPPLPPPNVPPLPEEQAGGVARPTSVRARLEEHRKNPACANCHERLDGMGFALENFDAIGGWRDSDSGVALDVTGELPDGSKFKGVTGLQSLLISKKQAVVRGMLERLLTYGIGRGIERYDQCDLDKMTNRTLSKGGRFSHLLAEVIRSKAFRTRRGDTSGGVTANAAGMMLDERDYHVTVD